MLPTYSGSNSGLKHTKLPTYPGGVNRDRSRRAKPDDMIALTLAASQPEFTQFLLERFGIVGNVFTVDEARSGTS